MIRYTLLCEKGHDFESWFRDSEAYDAQKRRKLVTCPICQSPKVEKTIMAPQVARKDRARHAPVQDAAAQAPVAVPETAPAMLLGAKERELRALISEVREKILAVTDDVGDRFAREARAMAEGDTEERPIRGQATAQEWRELIEDGIGVLPLPDVPDDHH